MIDFKNNIHKSLGNRASSLILGVYEKGGGIFSLPDAALITGLKGQSLLNLIHRLVKKGILTRLVSGLYQIIPFELGYATEYMGNPFVVAREVVFRKLKNKKAAYFISHGSAMDIHQMVTQPQLAVYTTVTKQIREQKILGTDFHFVTNKPMHFFGLQKHWVDKSEMVLVSDLEKTVLDGLKMPEYCGGITEVAKGFWMKRHEMSVTKLVDYAEKLNVGAVYRRLGFLLETYDVPCPSELERLQRKMNPSYLLLDPTLPNEGKYQAQWRLRLNITKDELLAVVRT